MENRLKEFFKKLGDNNSPDLLLLYRLYKEPFSVLGNEQNLDKIEQEYNNLYCYYQLMMNNNLIEFLNIVIFDSEFGKCDMEHMPMWIKLRNFLWDSTDFKNYYLYMVEHPELMDIIKRFKTTTVDEICQYSKAHPGI